MKELGTDFQNVFIYINHLYASLHQLKRKENAQQHVQN